MRINNIYHMLSYAFQTLNQETYDDVAVESFDELSENNTLNQIRYVHAVSGTIYLDV